MLINNSKTNSLGVLFEGVTLRPYPAQYYDLISLHIRNNGFWTSLSSPHTYTHAHTSFMVIPYVNHLLFTFTYRYF